MKKIIHFLLSLLVFIACVFQLLLSSISNLFKPEMICNKNNKVEFSECLNQHIAIGSSYEELKSFLSKHGFYPVRNQPYENNCFAFYWFTNDLRNYKIGVICVCNSELRVIKIRVV